MYHSHPDSELKSIWEKLFYVTKKNDPLDSKLRLYSRISLTTSLILVFADVLHHNKKHVISLIFTLCLYSNTIDIHV